MKFYTEDGNWDLVGNNTPVFSRRKRPWSSADRTSSTATTLNRVDARSSDGRTPLMMVTALAVARGMGASDVVAILE